MSTFNGNFTEAALKYPQFFVKKTDKNLIELNGAFSIDKVKIGFRYYDQSGEQGNRNKVGIDFYLTIPELELLCHNILSGNIITKLNKGMNIDPYYKGSDREGQTYSRVLFITKANKGVFFTVHEGPGQKSSTGAVKPAYDLQDSNHKKLSAMLTPEELKTFALQGKRACDFYYEHYFGRE